MADYTNGADTTDDAIPADDLRSTLAAALAASEAEAEPAPKPAPSDKTEERVEPKPDTDSDAGTDTETRKRGPDGKFLPTKKEGESDAEKEPERSEKPAEKKAESEKAPEAEADKNADGALKPSDRWSKQHKEIFAQATPQVQQFMLDREKQLDRMVSDKLAGHAEFRKRYEPVEALFKPYEATMKEKGLTPASLMEAWANVEKRLAQGDGINVIQGLIQGYKIDKAQLAQALGLQAPAARPAAVEPILDAQGNPIDPANLTRQQQLTLPPELIEEIKQLRARQDAYDNAARAAHAAQQNSGMQRVVSQIDEFKGETDGKGNLLHPHFEAVENQMVLLVQAAVASKQQVPPLKDLYEQAVWANASTRAKLLHSQKEAEQRQRVEESKTKAKTARAAGSSVTGTPGAGQTSQGKVPQDRPLLAEIEDAWNSVHGNS
jgi:hypothetical protein